MLQLACLNAGLIFCPYNPKVLTKDELLEQIRKLAIDCIITDDDHLSVVREFTQNPLRPLTKGVFTRNSSSQLLPVGWNNLTQSMSNADSVYTQTRENHPNIPAIRVLSKNKHVLQYSHELLGFRLFIAA